MAGKKREKCHSIQCAGKIELFPLYDRGYDNKFERVIKTFERPDGIEIRYGFHCRECNAIIFKPK